MVFDGLTKTNYICPDCEKPIFYDGTADEMTCTNKFCNFGTLPKDEFIKRHTKKTTVQKKGRTNMSTEKMCTKCGKKKAFCKGLCSGCYQKNQYHKRKPTAGQSTQTDESGTKKKTINIGGVAIELEYELIIKTVKFVSRKQG